MIVLPIEPWLVGRHHLIVEPDGVLKVLPIGLLVNSNGEYLQDHFAITISPGVAYLNRSRTWLGISPSSDALVVGNPKVFGWMPLPDAEQEARTVAASFDHPRLLLQSSLTPTNFAKEIAQAEVFHFSGHAQSTVESAGLVTGTDGLLDAFRLDPVSRGRSQLVVLSACSSSRGTGGRFDDDDSLVRRLMSARVPEVVASRWTVDSVATALLMKGFYSELLAGKPVSEALDSAMRSVRSKPEFAHPYYWAGFSVYGRS
jgi:CHAT domain-containing protein